MFRVTLFWLTDALVPLGRVPGPEDCGQRTAAGTNAVGGVLKRP